MFEGIVGNNKIKAELEKAVKQNKTSHSYLFVGISGIGKKMIAKEFAKMLLCLNEEQYCNNCKSCLEFQNNNQPDFIQIEPEGNSIKIEQIRELQKRVQEKPIISNKKIYIIDDADLMTQEAQNCLLKTLEEPPEFTTIILIGSNENAFLPTIKSRCMILHFQKIEDQEIKTFLQQNYEMTNISQNMLDTFQGSIKKAIELKDKQEEYQIIENLISNLDKKDVIDILNDAESLYKNKEEIYETLDYINIILLKMARNKPIYSNCIGIVEETKKRLKQNANYDMSIDDLLFKLNLILRKE